MVQESLERQWDLMNKALYWASGELDSVPGSATDLLVSLGKSLQPLWAPVYPLCLVYLDFGARSDSYYVSSTEDNKRFSGSLLTLQLHDEMSKD